MTRKNFHTQHLHEICLNRRVICVRKFGRLSMSDMATPRPSARSLKNLKRTAGPGRPRRSLKEKEAKAEGMKLAQRWCSDPTYRRTLITRMRRGTLAPGVEVHLLQMAYGKPKEVIEAPNAPTAVEIVHKFYQESKKKKSESDDE